MSLFPKSTAITIAESIGLVISDDVAAALVQDSEYRLREIIHEATKYMLHSKRTTLNTLDINLALRVKNVEPIYGYDSTISTEFKQIASANQILYYVPDRELDLDDIISGELPCIPLDTTVSAHWLSIEGVQPRIIQNPTPADLADREKRFSNTVSVSDNNTVKDSGPLVKTILTQELQLYYSKITECLISSEEDIRNSAIESITQDPGIQGLLPYLVEFLSETIIKNIKNLVVIWTMMRLVRAILSNSDLFVEPYLHHLVPNILSCLLAKKLTETHSTSANECRVYAGQLISHICHIYGNAYPTLVPRVTKTLLRAFLDSNKSLGCRFGSIIGLQGLGTQVHRMVVLPNVKSFGVEMKEIVNKGENEQDVQDAQICINAMESLIALMITDEINSKTTKGETRANIMNELHKDLGPQLGVFEKVLMSEMEVD